jgi:hypothetical protein
MKSWPVAVLTTVATLTAGAAAAQSRPPDPRSTARVHAGPVYLTPSITLKELGVDTNVFNQVENPKSDFTFTLTPHVDVWVPFAQRARVRVSTGADLVYYQKYETERSVNPQIGVRGEALFNRIVLFAEPTYLKTRVRPSFEIDARSEREESGVAFGTDIQALPRLSIALRASTLETDFADELFLGTSLQEALNRTSRSVGTVVRWAASPLTTFALKADVLEDRFPYSPVRNNNSLRIMPGVELKPRALISGSAYVGVRQSRTLDDAMPEFQGLVASARLQYILKGATRIEFKSERDINYSIDLLQPYYVSTGFGVNVQRHLAGRFDVMVGSDRYRNDYRHLTPLDATNFLARSDTIRNYSASVGYRLGKTGRLGFGGTYWQRDSNVLQIHTYDALRLGTSLTYGF